MRVRKSVGIEMIGVSAGQNVALRGQGEMRLKQVSHGQFKWTLALRAGILGIIELT
jgi:hypothetical protein